MRYGDHRCYVKIGKQIKIYHPDDVELIIEPKDEYYIRDACQNNSDSCLWWGKNSRGYTFDLKKAGVYTKAEVISIIKASSDDHRGYLKEEVDKLIEHHIHRDALLLKNLDIKKDKGGMKC